MRGQRFLRPSAAQSLCLFCACRVNGEIAPVLSTTSFTASRRHLNTSRPPHQSNATSTAPLDDKPSSGGPPSETPQWSGFDPNSPLSATEQLQKARLRQAREAREKQQQQQMQEQTEKQKSMAPIRNISTVSPVSPVESTQARHRMRARGRAEGGQAHMRLDLSGNRGQRAPQTASRREHRGEKTHTRPVDEGLEETWPESASNEGTAANWQHLRRRGEKQPQGEKQSHNKHHQTFDDDWIDRRFQEHQQQRQAVKTRDNTSPFSQNGQAATFNQRTVSSRKCGRCGQVGHVARECNGPMRGKCNICGIVGHYGKDCPQQGGNKAENQVNERVDNLFKSAPLQQKKEDPVKSDAPDAQAATKSRSERARKPADALRDRDSEGSSRFLRNLNFAEDLPEEREVAPKKAEYQTSQRGRDDDEDDDMAALREERAARKEARKLEKQRQQAEEEAERKARRAANGVPINLPQFVSVSNLAQALGVRYEAFVNRLEKLGYDDVFPGKVLNSEISGMIAMEYNFEPIFDSTESEAAERDLFAQPELADKSLLPVRPPVVTIMGHVDHGKTTILDYLRKSSVAAGEAGGITQHIGAFSVPLAASGKTITFLDTPGHAAFLAMRQRGANVTDIVILVVAADDSVKPQTLEAIKHAKSAGVPMIVAVNKIDKEEADLERVKQDLSRHGVEIEDYGGETQVVPVSGKTGRGMDELEEAAVTLSEILDHRAETKGMVEGWVLEATTKDRGRVATVLVRRGTLKQGDIIVAGKTWARVKTLRNEAGKILTKIGPGMPVEVDGWRDQPSAGDEVLEAPNEQKATDVIEFRAVKEEREKIAIDTEAINDARRLGQERREKTKEAEQADRAAKRAGEAVAKKDTPPAAEQQTGPIQVPFIIKADVSGSAEAVAAYILSVSSPFIMPKILESAVGPIHENDVEYAAAAEGHIIAFNLPANEGMKGEAMSKGVKVLENNIIYRVLDDVREVLEERLPPVVTQKVTGEAEISAAFEIGIGGRKKMRIAGCKVRNGVIMKGTRVRVMRKDQKIYDGTVSSLKNVKKDVTEMRKGTECGMGFEEWTVFEAGDMIQTYEELSEKRKL